MSTLSEERPHPDPQNADIPRAEYPRPGFVRDDWLTLNGTWQFAFDPGDSGLERGLVHSELPERITVPFCPESELSGIGDTDFHQAVWYRRTVRIPEDWRGRRPVLHFGAVDHDATVWVNGREVARHSGGFTSFSADLGGVVSAGDEAVVVVRARDPRQGPQARGKQSGQYANYSCHYTRTTGIWQSVWLEPVADTHLGRPRITPDLAAGCFHLELPCPAAARAIASGPGSPTSRAPWSRLRSRPTSISRRASCCPSRRSGAGPGRPRTRTCTRSTSTW